MVSCIQSCLQCPMRIQLFNKVSETNLTCGFVQTSEFFSIVALADVNECGTPYMGISPVIARPCTHRPEREQELHLAALLHGTSSGRMSLKKSGFGCEGKIIMFSFPKNPALREQWMQFVFSSSNRVSQVCLPFYKQGPVPRWICTLFDSERWSGPSYQRSRS